MSSSKVFSLEVLENEINDLQRNGRSIYEHPIARTLSDKLDSMGDEQSVEIFRSEFSKLSSYASDDSLKAEKLMGLGLGLGVLASPVAGKISLVAKNLKDKVPGANNSQVQGMAEAVKVPIQVGGVYASMVSPALLNGIAAQANASASALEGAGGVDAADVNAETNAIDHVIDDEIDRAVRDDVANQKEEEAVADEREAREEAEIVVASGPQSQALHNVDALPSLPEKGKVEQKKPSSIIQMMTLGIIGGGSKK